MKKTQNKQKRLGNKGFSLVELIVVIAIMAVLVGVLAPTLIRNIEKSRESKDITNLETLRGSIVTMLSEEKFYNALVPASSPAAYTVTYSSSGCTVTGGTLTTSDATAIATDIYNTTGNLKLASKAACAGTNAATNGYKIINVSIDSKGKVTVSLAGTTSTYNDTDHPAFTIE